MEVGLILATPTAHVPDDRADFESRKRASAASLAKDAELLHRAFELQVDAAKHQFTYLFSWLGVPIIQLPTDIVVTQEVIWSTRPDIIVETGIARGGSLIFSASMLRLLGGDRRVIGIDVDIRPHNRESIETHPFGSSIDLIEGSSIDPDTVARVRASIPAGAKVMVILDSDHSYAHVTAELAAYAPLVTPGDFLIVADTGLGRPEGARAPIRDWTGGNNPAAALDDFLRTNTGFARDPFINDKLLVTSSPGGYVQRVSG